MAGIERGMSSHVVLLGLMGAGKTSIGRIVAQRLGREMIDGDEVLVDRSGGRTAADIAEAEGLDALHELEADIAIAALSSDQAAVIAPAASVCDSAIVRDHIAGHTAIWLTAPVDHLARKAVKKSHRPLVHAGDPVDLLTTQLAVREPLVLALHPLVVDVSSTDDDAAAELIVTFARQSGSPS
jgi:shikimate kinase